MLKFLSCIMHIRLHQRSIPRVVPAADKLADLCFCKELEDGVSLGIQYFPEFKLGDDAFIVGAEQHEDTEGIYFVRELEL